ncbi:nucleotidyltransferase domain-containing protein [Anabaena subtropica]|uniref:Aminoglycoside nucleotidyltransferase n=1 Tax=Anabaena subtropica FACHB-260 TaxID=2692884 RepID=A0ABR8CUW1_9NOST|nr:aminoglycoside nucleotidyltransferase [Anabaena subtropica]MBD2346981.1 aminoglycoside nucleotidyltransferase [Anabaena subtropica FACHB-260]
MNALHMELIHQLFSAADQINLPLWLQGGWAIDAKLNRITREHEDIDIAYPGDRTTDFLALLDSLDGVITEQTSYGFLAQMQGVLLDCEPCIRVGDSYELEGLPPGTCPLEPTGILDRKWLRCTSWQAILWDYFYYIEEVPQNEWRPKDFSSFELAKESFGKTATQNLHEQFKRQYSA